MAVRNKSHLVSGGRRIRCKMTVFVSESFVICFSSFKFLSLCKTEIPIKVKNNFFFFISEVAEKLYLLFTYGGLTIKYFLFQLFLKYYSVHFSHSVVSNSLRPHESQHARPPCPSPTPGVHSDSRPSSR